MKKIVSMNVILTTIASIIILSGCTRNNSVTGSYYREFGDYISSTMFVELKKDGTFEADALTDPILPAKGTYEIDGNNVIFYFKYFWDLDDDDMRTYTGTISGRNLTVGDIIYKKQTSSIKSIEQRQEEDFRQRFYITEEIPMNISQQNKTTKELTKTIPNFSKYPHTFSIFISYANREMPLVWKDMKSTLTDTGYEFWYATEDETDGWMLYPNPDDEQELYYEFASLFGGLSADGENVDVLMYQLNHDADYVMVEFKKGKDRYIINNDNEEREANTLEELIEFATAALDIVYEQSYGN